MRYKETIAKLQRELPLQIKILRKEYSKIVNKRERSEKMNDLVSYRKRMKDGLAFLRQIKDRKTIETIEKIQNPPKSLTHENKQRYSLALKNYREGKNIKFDQSEIENLAVKLRNIPLIHTTKTPDLIKSNGIVPASELWLSKVKSCANAMDIILGLDKYVFLTHGFSLPNFSDSFVEISSELVAKETTLVSSLDLFTFVLIKTKKTAPCSIATQEWIIGLEDYSRNMFLGEDFWQIKAEYILTFFETTEDYNEFAKKHFYANFVSMSPENEYPFLGEVKILGEIGASDIL